MKELITILDTCWMKFFINFDKLTWKLQMLAERCYFMLDYHAGRVQSDLALSFDAAESL